MAWQRAEPWGSLGRKDPPVLCLKLDSYLPGDTEEMGLWSRLTDLDRHLTYHVTSQALFPFSENGNGLT